MSFHLSYQRIRKFVTIMTMILLIFISAGILLIDVKTITLPHGSIIHIFPARNSHNNHHAVVICPGGSYLVLKKWHEGFCWVPFFRDMGYTVAVLEYRMPKHDKTTPAIDGKDAMNLMRTCADTWKFAANKVGIMGFSAGGHLASTISVSQDSSIRPNFSILFYPVISMKKELTHQLTHDNLLGYTPSKEQELQMSNELHITKDIPSTYIAVSKDDTIVKPQNSILYHQAILSVHRHSSLHIYPDGGHGWGFNKFFCYHQQMLDDLKAWLDKITKI